MESRILVNKTVGRLPSVELEHPRVVARQAVDKSANGRSTTPLCAQHPKGSRYLGWPFQGATRNTGTPIFPDYFPTFADFLENFDQICFLHFLVSRTSEHRKSHPAMLSFKRGQRWETRARRSASGCSIPTAPAPPAGSARK